LVCALKPSGLLPSQNQQEDGESAGHASRSNSLLHVKVNRTRVFQSDLKTDGGAAWMVRVASSLQLHRVEAKDEWVDVTACIRHFYLNFVIFYVLGLRGILLF
jgi:spermidine synthase